MQSYVNDHFGDRAVADLQSIVENPTSLLFRAPPDARHVPVAGGEGLDILSASQYPHAFLTQPRQSSNKRKVAPPTASSQQLYGGIVVDNSASSPVPNSHDSLPTPDPARPRKRAKKAVPQEDSGPEDSTKRSRGRPRVDTHDETAADRRRTQIRLAQRAYRHRKETTISGLKQKVAELQSTIEQMNTTFLALHDNLMDSGLFSAGNTGLKNHIESVMSQFDRLSKDAALDDYDDEAPPPTKEATRKNAKTTKSTRKKPGQNTSPLQSSQESDIEEVQPTSLVGGESSLYAYDDAPWSDTSDVMQFHVHLPEAQVDLEAITRKNAFDTAKSVPRSLSSSVGSSDGFYTYSFQETTFARRLQRLSLERAFRHLTSPATSPAYLARAFRFTFCFSNRQRMLERFQAMLKRKAGEALENFNVPFYQIGGAGTHFPRRDPHGRIVLPPNMLGPERAVTAPGLGVSAELWGLQMSFADTPRQERSVQEVLEHLGYGGYWLDSHDVDEYLKTKGIFLDGTSSFAEVDPLSLTLDTELPGTGASPSSNQSSPLRTPSPFDLPATVNLVFPIEQPFTQQPLDDMFNSMLSPSHSPDLALQSFLASSEKDFRAQSPAQQMLDSQSTQIWPWQEPAPTISSSSHLDLNLDLNPNSLTSASDDLFAPITYPSYATTGNTKAPINFAHSAVSTIAREGVEGARAAVARLVRNGHPVTLDVERLLERLVDGGACLGRAPGFRKELVDHAVVMSLAEAF